MPIMLSSKGPTYEEMERLRLALSVFQDGSGWERTRTKGQDEYITYAGYRQFERVVAEVFGGIAPENKGIFDVLIRLPGASNTWHGVSCKMRNALKDARKANGRAYIELANAAGKFTEK